MKKSRVVSSMAYFIFFLLRGILPLLAVLLPLWVILAQHNPQDLKKQKSAQLWKIKKNQKLLSEINLEKRNNLSELNLIRAQINGQKKLLDALQQEISLFDLEISRVDSQTHKLENDLKQLQDEYGQMIYTAAKSSTAINHLNFVFASDDFNQLYRRLRYLRLYKKERKIQVAHIEELTQKLSAEKKKAQDAKSLKENLLNEKIQEAGVLSDLEISKSHLVNALSRREKDIKTELAQSQSQLDRLDRIITDRVGQSAHNSGLRSVELSKENIQLSKNFVNNKGRLPWPVSQGFIASPFGKHEHPLLKDVMVDNAGVDIQTSQGQHIKAVFGGKVSTIASIPGMGGQVVMLEHGEFFTVYAKVENILVNPGDIVKTQQSIATVYTDNQGNSLLQFQVWKNSEKLNPQLWLRKNP